MKKFALILITAFAFSLPLVARAADVDDVTMHVMDDANAQANSATNTVEIPDDAVENQGGQSQSADTEDQNEQAGTETETETQDQIEEQSTENETEQTSPADEMSDGGNGASVDK